MGVTLLLDGVILLMIGILGEYVGRIYEESKNRPLYILKDSGAQEEKKAGAGSLPCCRESINELCCT
ncbi:putative glycosyltransferase CsbB [compost metagenome]